MNTAGRSEMVTPSRIQAYAGRTLDFLQVIEKTIDGLSNDCDMLHAMHVGVVKVVASLPSASGQEKLDPDGRVCDLLSKSKEALERMHAVAARKRQYAQQDDRLDADDGVVEAFDALLACLSELHDALNEMQDWIETHDALLESSTGVVYSSASDLFKAILEKS